MSSMIFAMVADTTPAKSRTTAFSQLHASFLLSEFVAVPAAAPLLRINPWIPFLGSSLLMVTGLLMAAFLIRETFVRKPSDNRDDSQEIKRELVSQLQGLGRAVQQVRQNLGILLVITAFFVTNLSRSVAGVLLQYTSKKYRWTYDEASYIMALRSIISLFVLAVMIPALSKLFEQRLGLHTAIKDKRLTQVSGTLLIFGSLVTFMASAPWVLVSGQVVYALGFGFLVTARGLVTSLVDKSHLGILYTGIASITYCGMLVGGPLFANSFSWGMKLGDFWMGLPFLIAALLFFLAFLAVSAARVDSVAETDDEIE